MDSLLTEVRVIKIPRPKFYCSKGQLRNPSEAVNGRALDGSRGLRESGQGDRFQSSLRYSRRNDHTHVYNESDYPVEPPKDYYDDDLDIKALSIEDKTKELSSSKTSTETTKASNGVQIAQVVAAPPKQNAIALTNDKVVTSD